MIRIVFELPAAAFRWVDVTAPSREELSAVAKDYGLHVTSVKDCLDPEHLPKFERVGDLSFMIVRAYDEAATADADTVQELTRKVALFLGENFLVTIHRKDQAFLAVLREKWRDREGTLPQLASLLLADVLGGVLASYENPLEQAISAFEDFEERVFGRESDRLLIEEVYYLKRRASVMKRMLHLTQDILPKLANFTPETAPLLQDLKEECHRVSFYADELLENVTSLLNLNLSIASHRTNEVVRLLTVLSVFFLPLTFIVGVYGMNFDFMPELRWHWGYWAVWGLLGVVTASIFLWFRRRGWLR